MSNTKLELTWIGKDDPQNKINPEPRIFLENKELSYGDKDSQNLLIHGDNLLALKSLAQKYAGQVKCIYIDPPYNTGSAFEHYDDNLEHSTWLSLMKPRLELLRNLLSNNGTMWISIDADEHAYLKVLSDEVFGRQNFVDEIAWQRSYAPINLKKTLSRSHDYILVYAKNLDSKFELNRLPRGDEANDRYKNPDNDPRGPWKSSDLSVGPIVKEKLYEITTPSGRKVIPPDGRCWVFSKDRYFEMLKDKRIWFGCDGGSIPSYKRFLSDVKDGIVAQTLWTYQEVGHTQDAKKEVKSFNLPSVFSTPKPERLIERILTLGSNPGDLVLDSFLGSGTTAAVAHKMGRRWIGVELGEHCYTHCKPRLDAVIDGRDGGGITKTVNWQGGGGYKFLELAGSLIKFDEFDMPVISDEYNGQMLAAAMCLHKGYEYNPDEILFWKQGNRTNTNYIYTTTQFVNGNLVDLIASEMDEKSHVLICATAFEEGLNRRYQNITVQKIPNIILDRCTFDKDNYDLNIVVADVVDEEECDE